MAGLAAGCYGQMNGYETEIYELHNLPGGVCTAWERAAQLGGFGSIAERYNGCRLMLSTNQQPSLR